MNGWQKIMAWAGWGLAFILFLQKNWEDIPQLPDFEDGIDAKNSNGHEKLD